MNEDLDDRLSAAVDDLRQFAGSRLFITGGSGFVGTNFLESIAWANARMNLGIHATILTRNPEQFARKAQHLAGHPAFTFVLGDYEALASVRDRYDAFVHAATPASLSMNRNEPRAMLDVIIDSTKLALQAAAASGAIPFLFTSSGAVYGEQPASLERVPESYNGAPSPTDPTSAYHEGKRVAELLCTLEGAAARLKPKIARLFAFCGPYLPLDAHFAIGNFVGDAIEGRPIIIEGDGTAVRSYMYALDLVRWLWAILARGRDCMPYNVGSPEGISIAEAARRTSAIAGSEAGVIIRGKPDLRGGAGSRYVPDTSRAQRELHLDPGLGFDEGVRRMIGYAKS